MLDLTIHMGKLSWNKVEHKIHDFSFAIAVLPYQHFVQLAFC